MWHWAERQGKSRAGVCMGQGADEGAFQIWKVEWTLAASASVRGARVIPSQLPWIEAG